MTRENHESDPLLGPPSQQNEGLSLKKTRWLELTALLGTLAFACLFVLSGRLNFFSSTTTSFVPSSLKQHPHHKKVWKLLQQLDADMTGSVLFADDPSFDKEIDVWNQCTTRMRPPIAVIQVANTKDVSLAMPVLAKLKTYDVHFRIKSGGHSYTGWSSVEGGIILSLSRLNAIDFAPPPTSGAMVVGSFGPATTVLDVLTQVLVPHNYGLVTGVCPGVAEGGYVLGGGIGYMSRQYGLGVDNIVGAEIVLADGTVLDCNEQENSDLFWALRGAGQNNFGVVTKIDYRFYPTQEMQLFGEGLVPFEYASELIQKAGDMEAQLPHNCFFYWEGNNPSGLPMAISWIGTNDEELQHGQDYIIKTLAELLPQEVVDSFEFTAMSWVDNALASGNMDGNLIQAWNGFLMRQDNQQQVWDELIPLIQEVHAVSEYVTVDLELWGGAVSAKDPADTAFYWRNGLFQLGFLLAVPQDLEHADRIFADVTHKVNKVWKKIDKYLNGLYPNYAMKSLDMDSHAPEINWGGNLKRLSAVKQKYDPDNIFTRPQGVPLP